MSCRKLQSLEGEPFLLGLIILRARESEPLASQPGFSPPQSRPLLPGPELWPCLALNHLHVSLRCCFFHKPIQEIKKVGKELGITPTIIRDEELKTRGFGGG